MDNDYEDYDIVISGGGIAGCTLALALQLKSHYKIAVLEPQEPQWDNQHPSFDARVIALANESWKIMDELRIDLSELNSSPIKKISVTDRKHLGQTVLDANEQDLENFGRVVHLSALGEILYNHLIKTDVEYLAGTTIEKVLQTQSDIQIDTKDRKLKCKLLVLAEGGRSPTRQLLGIDADLDDYQQSAVIANIKTQEPHNGRAFERFSQHGPIALLPLPEDKDSQTGKQMSLVWCVSEDKKGLLIDYTDDEFVLHLQTLFGDRLGKLSLLSSPQHYPLSIQVAKQNVAHRVICIANTAQTLHPIAGQGFNLGLRDIRDLCKSIELYPELGSYKQTKKYQQLRKNDRDNTILMTDGLVRIFSNHYVPFSPLRTLGLTVLNGSNSAKNAFAAFAMGQR